MPIMNIENLITKGTTNVKVVGKIKETNLKLVEAGTFSVFGEKDAKYGRGIMKNEFKHPALTIEVSKYKDAKNGDYEVVDTIEIPLEIDFCVSEFSRAWDKETNKPSDNKMQDNEVFKTLLDIINGKVTEIVALCTLDENTYLNKQKEISEHMLRIVIRKLYPRNNTKDGFIAEIKNAVIKTAQKDDNGNLKVVFQTNAFKQKIHFMSEFETVFEKKYVDNLGSKLKTIFQPNKQYKVGLTYDYLFNQEQPTVDALSALFDFTDEAISISSGSSTGYLFLRSLAPATPNDSFDLKLINELKENRETYFEYLKQAKEKKATESVKKEELKQETNDLLGGDFSTEIGEFDADLDGFFL